MAIPDPYVWSDEFKVFYESIDKEHQGLFIGIFDMAADPSNQSKVDILVKAVVEHFKNEEPVHNYITPEPPHQKMLDAANYADAESHKKLHAEFVKKLGGVSAPVDQATVDFAKTWLVNHIKGVDFKYKGKL